MSWLSNLVDIPHSDPHLRRRGRLLAMILLAMIILAIVLMPVSVITPAPLVGLSITGICLAIFVANLVMVHRGAVTSAGWIFTLTVIGGVAASVAMGAALTSVFFLVLAIITVALVLPPIQIWWAMLIALGATGVATLFEPQVLSDPTGQYTLIHGLLVVVISTFLSALGAQATETALQAAEANAKAAAEAQARAESQARDLSAQTEALQRAEQRLQDLVATLETPTVPLVEGILLAPLVGSIDSRRAQTLTDRLLRDITAQRVQLLILDIAGVSLMDTAVAQSLVRIAQAVRLLGCRVVLTGIVPEVAMTLTQLGTDLGGLQSFRSPQEVLASLAELGVETKAARVAARLGRGDGLAA